MTWHCMLITYTFSSCQSNSLLAADSSAVQFGTLWASQMSALGPFSLFPAGLKGTGDSLSLASADFVLIWKEKWRTFPGVSECESCRGTAPLILFHCIYPHPLPHTPQAAFVYLFACVISCKVGVLILPQMMLCRWQLLSASDSCVAVDRGISPLT